MRDTLIWLTLKEQLKRSDDTVPQILFATEDTVFIVKEENRLQNRLHESLVYELEKEGVSRDSVTIRRKLEDVIEFISTPRA